MNMKKSLLALAAVACMALCLCACGDTTPTKEPTDVTTTTEAVTATTTAPATAMFEVKVVDQNGAPVPGVMMQICKDTCIPKLTDANGVAAFELEITDGYKLSVLTCPAGYTYEGEAEIYLESGSTSYTVEVQGEA